MLSAFGKRLLRRCDSLRLLATIIQIQKQRLHRWLEHKKWCWIESDYAKPICLLYFFEYQFPVKSSDVALVRISEKVKQSDNLILYMR